MSDKIRPTAFGVKTMKILAALQADPLREWSSDEIGELAGVNSRNVGNYVGRPMKKRLIFCRQEGRRYIYRAAPYEDQVVPILPDARQVTGWTPPKMVAPRAGSDRQMPSLVAFTPTYRWCGDLCYDAEPTDGVDALRMAGAAGPLGDPDVMEN